MGGFFGVVSKKEALSDVFFGTDYHSHLATHCAGIAAFDEENGLQREIKSIKNAPFRSKFEHIFEEMTGKSAIGCISDFYPQPLLFRSKLGNFAICFIGAINNAEELIQNYLDESIGGHFGAMTGGKVNNVELVSSLICQKSSFKEGIQFVQSVIDGSCTILILKDDGHLIAARDAAGRLPVLLGKNEDGYCVSFESFAYQKLGYENDRELGPGEIVEISSEEVKCLAEAGDKMKVCSFLWSYYGYSTSTYEGVNVEVMRYRNGQIIAQNDKENDSLPNLDFVSGVPDSGTPHAIGYAQESGIPFARAFIKYTPTWTRSFIPSSQKERSEIAKMKQIPVHELIQDKNLLFVDDSIVRGTQLKETVEFLYSNGAKAVHIRSACPPIMYNCPYLGFTTARNEMELIARRTVVELEGEEGLNFLDEYIDATTERGEKLRKAICEKLHFSSLEFQTLEGIIKAIGVDPSKLCTYCWNGKE
ncbi:MAG: amidophosphoribosyltransferase [Clostridia bacterium]|nr:amidophosphoribosyltransferase [Clostridia bacterium]